MNQEMILDYLTKLNSSHIAIRHDAVNFIHQLTEHDDLDFIFKHIQKNPNDDHIYTLLITCQNILEKATGNGTRLSVYILIHFNSYTTVKIEELSRKILFDFFKNNVIIDQIKILSLRYSWSMANENEKTIIVELVKEFKFGGLTYLLVDIATSKNEKLILKSLEAIIYFKETRANRFIRHKLSQEVDSAIFLKCLEAIGHVGNIFDFNKVKKHIKSTNIEVQKRAISSLIKLSPYFAIQYFFKTYTKLNSKLKKYLLHEVSTLNSIRGLDFLLEVHATDYKNSLVQLEWAIYNLSTKKKLKTIIKHYNKSDDIVFRYHLLNLMGDFHDSRCVRQYNQILKYEKNSILRTVTLENLSQYNHIDNINYLKNTFLNDKELSLTAYHGLLKLSKSLLLVSIEYYINDESIHKNPHNQLTLSYLKKPVTLEIQDASKYVIKMLQSNDIRLKLQAIDTCQTHHNLEIYELLISFTKDSNKHVAAQASMALFHILNTFTDYLNPKNIRKTEIELISHIDLFSCSQQLVIFILELEGLAQKQEISNILLKNKQTLTIRLNSIIQYSDLDKDKKISLINFMLKKDLLLSPENISFIKNELYFKLEENYHLKFLNQILVQKIPSEFNFLIKEVFAFELNTKEQNNLVDYLENVL